MISISLVVVAIAVSVVTYCGSSGSINDGSSGIIRDGRNDGIHDGMAVMLVVGGGVVVVVIVY